MPATVLQLSDTHLADDPAAALHDEHPDARLAAVLSRVGDGPPVDLVVLTGDNAEDGSPSAYRRLATVVRGLGAPVLAISGNHDWPPGVTASFDDPGSAEVGAWRVVGLESGRARQVHGTIDVDEALARLDALDDRPTVVAVHHPPRGPSTHPWFQLEGAEALVSGLTDRPHVKLVISGHLHQGFELPLTADRGLTLLGCPSTLYALHHDGDSYSRAPGRATGARMLQLDDDGGWRTEVLFA